MPDEHYVNPKLAALYDVTCGWSPDRDFYLALAGNPPQRILDLGCGTGLLCNAYAAQGHIVTGVDPAPAMLAVARQKPHGAEIEWVQANAHEFRTAARFDLIIMTGHAFQVLLTESDLRATLAMVRDHLVPDGRFVFESRNSAIDWAAEWNGVDDFNYQGSVIRKTCQLLAQTEEQVTFVQRWEWAGAALESLSTLRFLSRQGLEARLAAAGLRVAACYGDWNMAPFDPFGSHEMIFDARLA